MSTAPSAREPSPDQGANGDPGGGYARLRELLIGPEQARLEELQRRLDDRQLRTEDLSQVIAEAIALRLRRDRALQLTLNPIVEDAVRISVARDPSILANTLFPIIGAAVRKSVAHALRGLVESINQTLERSFSLKSLKWRIEALRTGKSFGDIVLTHSLRYRVEQVFLIHRETGLLLQHAARAEQIVQDSDLVSGMLTAIQDFVRDSFTGAGGQEVETIELGEFNLWVQHGPAATLAAVVSGTPPPELRNLLERTLEQIHGDFAAALSTFRGDTSVFAEAQPRLQGCLLGRGAKAAKGTSRGFFLAAAVAVIILIAAGLFLVIRHQSRWDKLLQRLRSEPGIVLTSAEESWGTYRLSGLRDPLSADPEELILASGVDPAKVRVHWEPYVSLHAKFKAERQFRSEKDALEEEVLRFPLNSAQLGREQLIRLDDVEAHLVNLQEHAASTGQRFLLEVRGHTDPSGNEDKNASLSQARADAVVKALIDRGISREMLRTGAMGSREPVRRNTGTYLSDLNRRVSFRVIVEAEGAR
jgi:outer membrane protein OmpA-like peptidoglycan-associated protein